MTNVHIRDCAGVVHTVSFSDDPRYPVAMDRYPAIYRAGAPRGIRKKVIRMPR